MTGNLNGRARITNNDETFEFKRGVSGSARWAAQKPALGRLFKPSKGAGPVTKKLFPNCRLVSERFHRASCPRQVAPYNWFRSQWSAQGNEALHEDLTHDQRRRGAQGFWSSDSLQGLAQPDVPESSAARGTPEKGVWTSAAVRWSATAKRPPRGQRRLDVTKTSPIKACSEGELRKAEEREVFENQRISVGSCSSGRTSATWAVRVRRPGRVKN